MKTEQGCPRSSRELSLLENIWGWWRGECLTNASQAWKRRMFPSHKYFKVMLCCSTTVTQTYPCNPIYLVYSQEPEAHSNFLKVCSVSQVDFITSNVPELLSLPNQTSFELDWLRFSHHILDEPFKTPLCRACGIHQGSLSIHTVLLSQASSLYKVSLKMELFPVK